MEDLWLSGHGVLSTQILQEFFVTVTSKISPSLNNVVAEDILKKLSKWDVVTNSMKTIFSAIELQRQNKFSFWDSLVIASALEAGVVTIMSEDLSDGQKIKGVTIHNPFRA